MPDNPILRQVALVSYGTRYLRNENELDDWYRHGIFFHARLQFRALADNALLADDFTVWLGILKLSGATRLSLHPAGAFGLAVPRAQGGAAVSIVAHFPDHHQIWTAGEEKAAWMAHPLFPNEEHQQYPVFPDAAGYGGAIDSYWCSEDRPGLLDVPETNWKQLTSIIAADLETAVPSSTTPAGPYIAPLSEDRSWAELPLFPDSDMTSLAHRIMATLARAQSTFDHDTHPKNENSPYRSPDQDGAARLSDWGRRLDRWITEVLLRCANECRDAASVEKATSFERMDAVAPAEQAQGDNATSITPAPMPDGLQDRLQATSKPVKGLAFILAFAGASLFVLALANILVAFPWAAILFGLPLALYVKDKRK